MARYLRDSKNSADEGAKAKIQELEDVNEATVGGYSSYASVPEMALMLTPPCFGCKQSSFLGHQLIRCEVAIGSVEPTLVWREFCKRCYEAKVEVAQPLTSSQFDKERKAASERCVGITAAATINASLERELNLFNVYTHNRQRFDDLLKKNDALKERIMSIREESTAKGGGEPVNKKQKKFHASLMEFKKAVDWAGENGLLFGDTMIDSIVASSKTANTTARRAHGHDQQNRGLVPHEVLPSWPWAHNNGSLHAPKGAPGRRALLHFTQ